MRTQEEVQKEIDAMKRDLELMKTKPIHSEEARQNAMFCQRQVISALEWCVE